MAKAMARRREAGETYRISVRGDLPPNLAERLSALHASAPLDTSVELSHVGEDSADPGGASEAHPVGHHEDPKQP